MNWAPFDDFAISVQNCVSNTNNFELPEFDSNCLNYFFPPYTFHSRCPDLPAKMKNIKSFLESICAFVLLSISLKPLDIFPKLSIFLLESNENRSMKKIIGRKNCDSKAGRNFECVHLSTDQMVDG